MTGDTDTLGPVDAAPREGCPAWCTEHYCTVYSERLTVEGHQTSRSVEDPLSSRGKILIQVLQSVPESGKPTLHIESSRGWPVDQAADVADLLRNLGHGAKVAAAVEELAALVTAAALA